MINAQDKHRVRLDAIWDEVGRLRDNEFARAGNPSGSPSRARPSGCLGRHVAGNDVKAPASRPAPVLEQILALSGLKSREAVAPLRRLPPVPRRERDRPGALLRRALLETEHMGMAVDLAPADVLEFTLAHARQGEAVAAGGPGFADPGEHFAEQAR